MDIAAGHTLESEASAQGSPRRTIIQRADELSDEQFMARLDGPEIEAALSALYDRYSRTVFGVGLNILGDRSLAEELVQEVFLKVWRSSGTFDPSRGSFSTWLLGSRAVLPLTSIVSAPAGFPRCPTGTFTSAP
jgi:hypothetical protein